MTEIELIESAQDHIIGLKKDMRAIQKLNEEAGRGEAANAAMKWRGEVIRMHGLLMEEMYMHYPEFASGIQARGGDGGGR